MKRKKIFKLDFTGAVILCFLILAFVGMIFFLFLIRPIHFEGSPAVNFCTEKCGTKDYFASVNNSEYGVIQCECVEKLVYGDGKYTPTVRVESSSLYFDANTLEEISKKEFYSRIK
jgi:hypothetical protein